MGGTKRINKGPTALVRLDTIKLETENKGLLLDEICGRMTKALEQRDRENI
jgi:hypothetical protein